MSLQGIDVSMWQPSDFHLLPAAGYGFAICKATEGGPDAAGRVYLDPTFAAKWAGIKAAGLLRGCYHFARPDLGNSAQAEADAFLTRIGSLLEPGDFCALDLEKGGGDLAAWAWAWLTAVEAGLGFRPMVYADLDYLRHHGLQDHPATLGQFGLWLADPGIPEAAVPSVPGWAFTAVWQSGSAQVPGFPSPVDHDVFFGDRAQLLRYGKPSPPAPTPTPAPPPPPAPPWWERLWDWLLSLLGGW